MDDIGYQIGYNLAKFAFMFVIFKLGYDSVRPKKSNKQKTEVVHVVDKMPKKETDWMTAKQRDEFNNLITRKI